uniref:Uncharacterized protein n=1 Tax=Oryza glumipatula TaxID=40148 RepID=A0A0D9YIJ2_9ORYZ
MAHVDGRVVVGGHPPVQRGGGEPPAAAGYPLPKEPPRRRRRRPSTFASCRIFATLAQPPGTRILHAEKWRRSSSMPLQAGNLQTA